jgi:hypothetical protein
MAMTSDHNGNGEGSSRRKVLECMTWAGTGILWTVMGGVPKSVSLLGSAQAATAATQSFTFAQISDSHIGFHLKPVNPDALGTLKEAIAKVRALPAKPAFMIHTGDITHLSKPDQFDDAAQVIGSAGLDVHYIPGEHDLLDETPGKSYLERYGKNTKGAGWYSFDHTGVHFIALVNVVNLQAGSMGVLGAEQLAWLADDVKGLFRLHAYRCPRSYSIVDDLQGLGLGHRRCGASIVVAEAIRFADRAQRSYSSNHTEGGGQRRVPHRAVDGLSAASAWRGSCAGADGCSG